MIVDTAYNIDTPEGVQIQVALAGLGARAMAWLCDALLKFAIVLGGSFVGELLGELGGGLYLILLFLLFWAYNVIFEVFFGGATPGKRWQGIRVVNSNGTPVTFGASVLRNLVRAVDALPLTYLFGCVSMLLSQRSQRLGDLAADTLVVYVPEKVATKAQRPNLTVTAVPIPLLADEQEALVTFAERSGSLASERQDELAAILSPVFDDVSAARLHAYANWLTGREEGS